MTNNRSEDMDTSSFCDADGFGISKDGFTACVNQTIFTLIPFLAFSNATHLVSPTTACFEVL